MTVAELIELLKEQKQDAVVFISDGDYPPCQISKVITYSDGDVEVC